MDLQLRSIIKVQNKFREIKNQLNTINNDMTQIKDYINSQMTTLQQNYDIDLITKEQYISNMEKLDLLYCDYIKLPLVPVSIYSLKEQSVIEIQVAISSLFNKLRKSCENNGMTKICKIIKLYCGQNWLSTVSNECYNLLVFYDRYVDPFKVEVINKDNKDEYEEILDIAKNIEHKMINTEPFCIRSYPTITKSFIEKIDGIKIYIPFQDSFIKIYGILKKDSLGLSKDDFPFREKYGEVLINLKHLDIPDNFKYGYLQQMSLRDFISNNQRELLNKIKNNYNHLQRLKNKTLSQLVKEFTKSTIEKQRNTVILLLLSDKDDDHFLAHILYDMIANDSFLLKAQPNSNFIYKSLHWSMQKKLKVTKKKVEESKKKEITEEDIPYDKRISLLKAPNKVKAKAREKLKEMQGTRESSSKAQHYLEGLLKVPFGVYKKESILSFLSDFKLKLDSTILVLIEKINDLEESKLKDLLIFIGNKYEECKSSLETETDINNFIKEIMVYLNNLDLNLVNIEADVESEDEEDEIVYNINKNMINDFVNKIRHIQKIRKALVDHEVENIDSLKRIGQELSVIERKLGMATDQLVAPDKSINDENINEINGIYEMIHSLVSEWNDYKENKKEYLRNIRHTLDKCVHGHDECKKHIERIIGQWMNGKMKGTVFGLHGPPGTGKTSIAKEGIAKCLVDVEGNPRPFCFLPLGGSSNGSTLEGHNYTYLGSTWGKIIDMIMDAKCMNPIIYIDEVDKVSATERGREVISILTHLTDPSQNKEFTDRFFSGINFDLSQAIFIFSYNDRSLIDSILFDRITEIQVKPISNPDKVKITKDYLLPEIVKEVGFKEGDIEIHKKEILFIIENYTYEAGVRKLKEKLYEIVRHLNLQHIMEDDVTLPHRLTTDEIEDIFSSRNKVIIKKCAKKPHIGMVNGLYATSMGTGGLTFIEVHKTVSEQKLALELTGSQGDVMKESMKVAKTLAWNIIPKEIKKSISTEWKETGPFGLHIHCPAGATPKDGPSAGTAITCGIISRLCNLPVRNDVAMTGEINLRGQVTAIGGVDSKVEGAKRAGARKVLLPKDNEQDYKKYVKKLEEALATSGEYSMEMLKAENNIEVVFVEKLEEVIPHIFVENDLEFNCDF